MEVVSEKISVFVKKLPLSRKMIGELLEIELAIGSVPGAKFGDDACPIIHTFADGLYIREMRAPEKMFNVSELHKTTHPYFIMKGEFSVLTEKGSVRIKAPFCGITKAGTKRAVYFHEDTIWITIHANPDNETDLSKIKERLIAQNYEDLPENIKEKCL